MYFICNEKGKEINKKSNVVLLSSTVSFHPQ